MHQELVERKRWLSESRFLHALNYCMLLPGPEAQQLAVYVGWLLHRTLGGLVAGILFVLPGSLLMLSLSWAYAVHGSIPWVAAIFFGLRASVVAIVAAAVLRLRSRALRNSALATIAALAFAGIFLLRTPFPLLVLGAGLVGLIGGRLAPHAFQPPAHAPAPSGGEAVHGDDDDAPEHARPTLRRSAGVLAVGLAAWWAPLAMLIAWRGTDDVLAREATFFSGAAMVTFGGAYAVLAYIQQAAVERFGWLLPGQMLDGLGLAETTPGPLILVTQFVGFLGAYRNPGDLAPIAAGILGAAVTTWATFAPCFLWIFLGAPYIERLRGNLALGSALAAVTAAVVGVVLNLAVTFGLRALFGTVRDVTAGPLHLLVPEIGSIDLWAAAIALVAFLGMKYRRWEVLPVVLGSAVAGLVVRLIAAG
jgi:chromate transporter